MEVLNTRGEKKIFAMSRNEPRFSGRIHPTDSDNRADYSNQYQGQEFVVLLIFYVHGAVTNYS